MCARGPVRGGDQAGGPWRPRSGGRLAVSGVPCQVRIVEVRIGQLAGGCIRPLFVGRELSHQSSGCPGLFSSPEFSNLGENRTEEGVIHGGRLLRGSARAGAPAASRCGVSDGT